MYFWRSLSERLQGGGAVFHILCIFYIFQIPHFCTCFSHFLSIFFAFFFDFFRCIFFACFGAFFHDSPNFCIFWPFFIFCIFIIFI